MNKNMTALVSAFARIYHIKNSNIKIYNDMYAEKIITDNEYNEISINMKKIQIFNGEGKTREEKETLFRSPKVEQKNKNGGVCM